MKKFELNTLRYLSVAAIIAVAMSCAKDDQPQEKEPSRSDIIVCSIESVETKTALSDSDKRLTVWKEGDSIAVWTTDNKTAIFTAIEGGSTKAKFEITSQDEGFSITNFETAFYPASRVSGYDTETNTYTYVAPSVQNCTAGGSFVSGVAPMISSYMASGQEIKFRNAFAGIKLPVTCTYDDLPESLSKITVTSTSCPLSGSFEITSAPDGTSTGTPTVSAVTGSVSNNVTMSFGNGINLSSSATDFYIMVPSIPKDELVTVCFARKPEGSLPKDDVIRQTSKAEVAINQIVTMYPTDVPNPPGRNFGPFSVSPTKKVWISQGNLQYLAKGDGKYADGSWRFAEEQYHFYGTGVEELKSSQWFVFQNGSNGCDWSGGNTTVKEKRDTQRVWIDLFGLGTTGASNSPMPYGTSVDYTVYCVGVTSGNLNGTANDWGWNCTIWSGSTKVTPGTYRLLSNDEWAYLIDYTHQSSNPERYGKFGCGCIVYDFQNKKGTDHYQVPVRGFFLIPDQFTDPNVNAPINSSGTSIIGQDGHSTSFYPCTFTSDHNESWLYNVYFADSTWQTMENNGVAFIPMAAYRNGTEVSQFHQDRYWTATVSAGNSGGIAELQDCAVKSTGFSRHYGASVRLFMDYTGDPIYGTTPYIDGGNWNN